MSCHVTIKHLKVSTPGCVWYVFAYYSVTTDETESIVISRENQDVPRAIGSTTLFRRIVESETIARSLCTQPLKTNVRYCQL